MPSKKPPSARGYDTLWIDRPVADRFRRQAKDAGMTHTAYLAHLMERRVSQTPQEVYQIPLVAAKRPSPWWGAIGLLALFLGVLALVGLIAGFLA